MFGQKCFHAASVHILKNMETEWQWSEAEISQQENLKKKLVIQFKKSYILNCMFLSKVTLMQNYVTVIKIKSRILLFGYNMKKLFTIYCLMRLNSIWMKLYTSTVFVSGLMNILVSFVRKTLQQKNDCVL